MTWQLTTAIVQMLRNDPTVSGMLTTFHGVPAVFSIAPYPEGAQRPLILTEGSVTDTLADTKTTIGHDIIRDIRCYTDETGDETLVDQIGLAVNELFHKHEAKLQSYMPNNDFMIIKCWAEGPRTSNVHTADEYVYGRIVQLTIWMDRNLDTMTWPPI